MLANLEKSFGVFLSLYCGFGKTVLTIKACCDLGYKPFVLTYSTTVYIQWIEAFKEFTNGKVEGLTKVVDVLPEADFYICMVSLAEKLDFSILKTVGIVVIDEAHGFCTPIRSQTILKFTPLYRIGLSATPKRNDGLEKALPLIFGPSNIIHISKKPFTVYRVNTLFKPIIEIVRFGKFKGRPNWDKVITSISNNLDRNVWICHLVQSKPNHKTLILCKRLEQVDCLYNLLLEKKESVQKVKAGITKYKSCRVLIGTFAKISVGFDEKGSCIDFDGERINMVILACDIGTAEALEQSVGRSFRSDSPEIYDIVDDYSTFKKHFKEERLPWYTSRQAILHTLNLFE